MGDAPCSNVAESVGRSAGAFQMAQMIGQRHCLNDMPTGAANPGVFRGDDTVAFAGFFLEYGAISNVDRASRFDHGTRLFELR